VSKGKKKAPKVQTTTHTLSAAQVLTNDNGDEYLVRLTVEAERVTVEDGKIRPVPADQQDHGLTMIEAADMATVLLIGTIAGIGAR